MVVGIDLLLVRRRRASTPRGILALLRWHRTVTVPARSRNLSTFHLCKLTISLPLFSSILLSVQTPHDLKKDVDILRELEGLGILLGVGGAAQKKHDAGIGHHGGQQAGPSVSLDDASSKARDTKASFRYILPDLHRHCDWVKEQARLERSWRSSVLTDAPRASSVEADGTSTSPFLTSPTKAAARTTTTTFSGTQGKQVEMEESSGVLPLHASRPTQKRSRAPEDDSSLIANQEAPRGEAQLDTGETASIQSAGRKKAKPWSSRRTTLFQRFGVRPDGTLGVPEASVGSSSSEMKKKSSATKKKRRAAGSSSKQEPDPVIGASSAPAETVQLEEQIRQAMLNMASQNAANMPSSIQGTAPVPTLTSQNDQLVQVYGLLSSSNRVAPYSHPITDPTMLRLLQNSASNPVGMPQQQGQQQQQLSSSSPLFQQLMNTGTFPLHTTQSLINPGSSVLTDQALAQLLLQQQQSTMGQPLLFNHMLNQPQQLLPPQMMAFNANPLAIMNANPASSQPSMVGDTGRSSEAVLPRLLYLEGDEDKLSSYQVALRKQIEGM